MEFWFPTPTSQQVRGSPITQAGQKQVSCSQSPNRSEGVPVPPPPAAEMELSRYVGVPWLLVFSLQAFVFPPTAWVQTSTGSRVAGEMSEYQNTFENLSSHSFPRVTF